MNFKKFLHDHIPFLPHGSWKKAAESINRKPQNFNEKSGWPHMVSKLEEAEKVLGAWGYELKIKSSKIKLVDVPHFDGLGDDPESI